MRDETITLARAFVAEDIDSEGRAEIEALLTRADAGEAAARLDLEDRFAAPLAFGTAGLRGRVEAGLARMNRLVVIKVSWGLGAWLIEEALHSGPEPREQGVVVAFDGRYSSRQFAEDAAAALAGLGIPVHLFPDPAPTPLLSFAVPQLGAAAGVAITASHNPPADNGYKVYLANGAQIVPPVDAEIATAIARAPHVDAIARPSPAEAAARGLRRLVDVRDGAVEAAYLDGLARASLHPEDRPGGSPSRAGDIPLRIAYTAMHGVGHRLAIRALARAGFEGVAVTPSQSDPDGAFRTVPFPNPEEPGAMDRVLALAAETGAELVLANDPDGDRLAAAVPDVSGRGYRLLTGNELGVLLADDAIEHADTSERPKLVVTTIVSSSLLPRMARDRGVTCRQTLTGFKWIAHAALRAEAEGYAFVFGYEEALGYTVGPLVHDKDGIGAALRLAETARRLKAEDRTLLGRLDELLIAHGLTHQVQWSVRLEGTEGRERVRQVMASLRSGPLAALGSSPVVRFLDAASGQERLGGEVRASALPRADLLAFEAEDGSRFTVRPSGTEPKIKLYLELIAHAASPAEVASGRERLEAAGQALRAELMQRLRLD